MEFILDLHLTDCFDYIGRAEEADQVDLLWETNVAELISPSL